jgi:hypothetical protein
LSISDPEGSIGILLLDGRIVVAYVISKVDYKAPENVEATFRVDLLPNCNLPVGQLLSGLSSFLPLSVPVSYISLSKDVQCRHELDELELEEQRRCTGRSKFRTMC